MSKELEAYIGMEVWITRDFKGDQYYGLRVWKGKPQKHPTAAYIVREGSVSGRYIHSMCYSDWLRVTGHALKHGEVFGPCHIGVLSVPGTKGEKVK